MALTFLTTSLIALGLLLIAFVVVVWLNLRHYDDPTYICPVCDTETPKRKWGVHTGVTPRWICPTCGASIGLPALRESTVTDE